MGCRMHTSSVILIFAAFQFVQGSGNASRVSTSDPAHGMPVIVDVISNIGRPGVLLYNRESESVINMDYVLNCTSYDTIYTILATTSAGQVATIMEGYTFNISCVGLKLQDKGRESNVEVITNTPDDKSGNDIPPFVGVVTGRVNMTVKARMIGRAFLMLFARKLNDPYISRANVGGSRETGNISFLDNGVSIFDTYTTRIISEVTEAGQQAQGMSGRQAQGMPGEQAQGMSGEPTNVVGKAMIIVMQLPRTIDEVFRIVLYVVIVLATTGMGVKVDVVVIKQVLRRPTAPLIGLCCQYICMPLIAYLVAKVIPQESAALSLGIFACGIVPGGGPSNMFSYLLGGDLSLSVTMTTLSNIAALGLLPLWIFTLGDTFKDDTVNLHVPYEKILEALAVVILPLFLGIFIKYKLPRVAKIISKVLKPVLIVIVAFTISFGIYIHIYIFEMIRPMTIVAGCLLPYIGYLLGGLISFLSFRSWTHIKTIAIETGIQNTSIAFLILYLSLPPPDNQLAAVGPASSAIMTPLPLLVAVFVYVIHQRCKNRRQSKTISLEEAKHANGDTDKREGETVARVLVRDDEVAAIVLVWQRITGQKLKKNVFEEILNKELEIMRTEK